MKGIHCLLLCGCYLCQKLWRKKEKRERGWRRDKGIFKIFGWLKLPRKSENNWDQPVIVISGVTICYANCLDWNVYTECTGGVSAPCMNEKGGNDGFQTDGGKEVIIYYSVVHRK